MSWTHMVVYVGQQSCYDVIVLHTDDLCNPPLLFIDGNGT